MKCRVYRNLDRPFTLLGVKGKYIPVAGAGLVAIIILALIVGSILGTFAGLATALALVVGGYLALTEIQQKFGEDRIDDGIEFMLKSLGADMASPMSSAEPAVLELVGSKLSVARSLNSGKSILGGFVSRLGSAHGLKTVMSPANLLKDVLNISKQRFITPASIRALYSAVPKQRPDTEVLLAQDLLGACRNLSSEIFDSDESRLRVIDALEQLVDGLVDEEDKWLEAGAEA